MDFQRGTLDVLFSEFSPNLVLNGIFGKNEQGCTVQYDKIDFEPFYNCALKELGRYGEDEIDHLHMLLEDTIKRDKVSGVFGLLPDYAETVLVLDRDEPKCRFQDAIRWREISYKIGQDILTTAILAKRDVETRYKTEYFAWPATIKTDNDALHHVLNKGFSENHYHLYGSTQVFPLNWVCLMNYVVQRGKEFGQLRTFLQQQITFDSRHPDKFDYHHLCLQAAAIRAMLFAKYSVADNYPENITQLLKKVYLWPGGEMNPTELQHFIEFLQYEYGNRVGNAVLDYALSKSLHVSNFNNDRILAGERYFLYSCFRAVFDGSMDEYSKNLFYAYLLIKAKFRGELVQVNNRPGFRNFEDYQDRKKYFIRNYPQYGNESERLAVLSPFDCQKLLSMEVRVGPEKTASGYLNSYYKIQNSIHANRTIEFERQPQSMLFPDKAEFENRQRQFNEKYKTSYVIHFIKNPDEKLKKHIDAFALSMQCRHSKLREEVKCQALALIGALSKDQRYRNDIVGIDACNNEVGCRPEVFAQAYRFLCNYRPETRFYDAPEKFKLNATYHAGEDFLDLTDGLRAIDEAIYFCGLTRDSRIGHTLALGTSPKEYYTGKHRSVVMTKQGWLDDIAWIYGKSNELGIDLKPIFQGWCLNQFSQYFSQIYQYVGIDKVDIINYYSSWKLRGDNPELYKCESYHVPAVCSPYDRFAINEPASEKELLETWRKNKTLYELYKHYHFDGEAKKRGSETETFNIPEGYTDVIIKIQEEMRRQICEKGICIECNPSSNLVIGTFRRYDKHPIFTFYNKGLGGSFSDKQALPQLCVSVNTDDQGVFDTLLENEYELLACSLFEQKDGDGHKKFAPENIYSWIDSVREMGNRQTFE